MKGCGECHGQKKKKDYKKKIYNNNNNITNISETLQFDSRKLENNVIQVSIATIFQGDRQA